MRNRAAAWAQSNRRAQRFGKSSSWQVSKSGLRFGGGGGSGAEVLPRTPNFLNCPRSGAHHPGGKWSKQPGPAPVDTPCQNFAEFRRKRLRNLHPTRVESELGIGILFSAVSRKLHFLSPSLCMLIYRGLQQLRDLGLLPNEVYGKEKILFYSREVVQWDIYSGDEGVSPQTDFPTSPFC